LLLALAPEAVECQHVFARVGVNVEADLAADAGLLELVEGRQRHVDGVAHALDVEQHAVGSAPEQGAAQMADHCPGF
jgi:hypothetical protein